MRSHDSTLAAALAYARRGWPVFPCKPGLKEPDTRHGFKDATTDPLIIAAWWRARPGRNVAIATGAPGPDVLDVDIRPHGDGYASYDRLKQDDLLPQPLAVIATPSGGLHVYFTGTLQPGARLPSCHLDFKAAGGYVVAPPSRVGGRPYVVVNRSLSGIGGQLDWFAVSTALVPDLRPHHERPFDAAAHVDRLIEWVARLEEGNRNSGLFWAACRLAEAGREDALAGLADAARAAGLGDREISRTIDSALRTVAAQ